MRNINSFVCKQTTISPFKLKPNPNCFLENKSRSLTEVSQTVKKSKLDTGERTHISGETNYAIYSPTAMYRMQMNLFNYMLHMLQTFKCFNPLCWLSVVHLKKSFFMKLNAIFEQPLLFMIQSPKVSR